jgi:hypothetical protein
MAGVSGGGGGGVGSDGGGVGVVGPSGFFGKVGPFFFPATKYQIIAITTMAIIIQKRVILKFEN